MILVHYCPPLPTTITHTHTGSPEAFELRVRPALDSVEAGVDRMKMQIYTTFAKYGLPCPVTGHPASGQFADQPAGSPDKQ